MEPASAIDGVYQTQRLRLVGTVLAGASAAWAISFRDRDETLERILPLVFAGQAHSVSLVDAYMSAKASLAGHRSHVQGLNPALYTVDAIRKRPAREVYERPFGAFGAHLAAGTDVAAAVTSGLASLERLVRTDLQLAQTHAARDWMAAEDRVVGYRRVLGPGKNCELCEAASLRRYRKEHLLPIHEHCGCWVEPIFGTEPLDDDGGDSPLIRIAADPELGLRLLAAT